MKPVSTPITRRHVSHAARNGHRDATGPVQLLTAALFTQILRWLVPSLRSLLPPPRYILGWQLRRLARHRAVEQQRRQRRRRIAIAATGVALAVALAAARALTRR